MRSDCSGRGTAPLRPANRATCKSVGLEQSILGYGDTEDESSLILLKDLAMRLDHTIICTLDLDNPCRASFAGCYTVLWKST